MNDQQVQDTAHLKQEPVSQQEAPKLAGGIDQEVDLLEYLNAILEKKYKLTIAALIGAVFVLGLTLMQDNIYLATSVQAINIDEKPGGIAPKEYRSGDTIGLIERDFVIGVAAANERERILARMRSARFSEIFISENNLLPYIFRKQWNKESQKWKDGFKPDMRNAIKVFNDSIRTIEYDEKSGLLRIHFKTTDPDLSASLANKFVNRFNTYARGLALDELSDRRNYLEGRLREVQNLELHRSIFRLLETQLAAETLINARKTFPLEEIQPAVAPLLKFKPKRLFTAASSFIGFLFLGITLVIGMVLFKKINQGLSQYSTKPSSTPESEIKRSDGFWNKYRSKSKRSEIDEADDWIDK